MKKKIFNKLGMIVVAIIVLSFVFTGLFTGLVNYGYNDDKFYTIGDYDISLLEVDRYRTRVAQMFKEENKSIEEINSEVEKIIHHRYAVLNEMNNKDVEVSDNEIYKALTENENFLKEGGFSKELYFDFLKFYNISAKKFEESIKEEIILRKYFDSLEYNTKINEEDFSFIDKLDNPTMVEVIKKDESGKVEQFTLEEFYNEYSNINKEEYELNKDYLNSEYNMSYKYYKDENFYNKKKNEYRTILINNYLNKELEKLEKKYPLIKH